MSPWAERMQLMILDTHERKHMTQDKKTDVCLFSIEDREEKKRIKQRRRNRHVQKLESEMSQPRCMVNMNNNHTSSRLSPNLVTAHPTNQLS